MTGKVLAIYLWPKSRGEPRAVEEATARAGGLVGDRKRAKKRQLTLLGAEDWAAATREAGSDAPPVHRRANVVLSGVKLGPTIGARLRVGEVVLEVRGETTPCHRMDEVHAGLRAALAPDVRAGVFGSVEKPGIIRVGDPVEILDQ